jgi:hypothetical protein
VLRKGALVLIYPHWAKEQALAPLENGAFRVGQDERSPERLCFGSIVEDQALSFNLSGGEHYRTFTP